MKKHLFLILAGLLMYAAGHAQFTKYVIQFKDKGTNPFSISNPSQYLTQRSLDRRARYNIPIDSSDLPVTPRYIDSIRLSGNVTILNVSKWLNQVSIQTTDPLAMAKINTFPFVAGAFPIAARTASNPVNKSLDHPSINDNQPLVGTVHNRIQNDFYDYGQSAGQVQIHQGNFLHNHGFRGEGMQLAVLDAGFLNYNSIPTFDSLLLNNRLLGTWDFVDKESSVAEDFFHGTQCLSTIAADMPGIFVGTAPKASFYLYRTEDVNSEYPIEEHNFAVGVERADSLGADLCSTSLGYTQFDNPVFNYTYADMDGNTTISARASDFAARKGMLMVTAAGNEGTSSWHYLSTPSDADSALAVGAVNLSGNPAAFSSYGPSPDGDVKPSVAAVGWNAVVASTSNGQPITNSGTSFACPNMAGIATCLWQAFPEASNMAIIDVLKKSATKYDNPDDRVGFGIPDAKKAFVMLQKMYFSKQSSFQSCQAILRLSVKTDATMNIEVERKFDGETLFTPITVFHNDGGYAMHDFEFADDLSGTNHPSAQYRFKMVIGSDTTYYLDSATVNFPNPCDVLNNSITIAPNPVTENVYVSITRKTASRISIVVQNAAGQKMYGNSYQQPPGNMVKSLPMLAFSKGVYFVSVFIDGKKEITKKILRQ
jgi:subtilisin family serine protease